MLRQINERSPRISSPLPVIRVSVLHHIDSVITQSVGEQVVEAGDHVRSHVTTIVDGHVEHTELVDQRLQKLTVGLASDANMNILVRTVERLTRLVNIDPDDGTPTMEVFVPQLQ